MYNTGRTISNIPLLLLLILVTHAATTAIFVHDDTIGLQTSTTKTDASSSSSSCTSDADKNEKLSRYDNNDKPRRRPLKVGILGCGPGGMFFLHAVALQRKRLEEQGDVHGLALLPDVTVFERESEPGGIWRAVTTSEQKSSTTNMYDGLWLNAGKETLEFFDYTFDDHFGHAMPAFLTRKQMLEYMLARVTSVDENIFRHVQFNTTVKSVSYDHNKEKFNVYTSKSASSLTSNTYDDNIHNSYNNDKGWEFDKFIYAGGVESKNYIPTDVRELLTNGGFTGHIRHSTEVSDLPLIVKGKRLLIIGSSYSAEDITLQALKYGAEQIYIVGRSENGIIYEVAKWPGNRVKVFASRVLYGVRRNGTSLVLAANIFDESSNKGEIDGTIDLSQTLIEIHNISIIIFCTGYESDTSPLAKDLQYDSDPNYWDITFTIPHNWTMSWNVLTDTLQDVEPASLMYAYNSYSVRAGIYDSMLIDNPNMMHIGLRDTEWPLLEIEQRVWLCLAYIRNDIPILSKNEMEHNLYKQRIEEMHIPYYRQILDINYRKAIQTRLPSNHWYNTGINADDMYYKLADQSARYDIHILATMMEKSGHPTSFYEKIKNNDNNTTTTTTTTTTNKKKLSKRGKQFLKLWHLEESKRRNLGKNSKKQKQHTNNDHTDCNNKEDDWMTFRDTDHRQYASLYTGTQATPLKGLWIDLDDDGNLISDLT